MREAVRLIDRPGAGRGIGQRDARNDPADCGDRRRFHFLGKPDAFRARRGYQHENQVTGSGSRDRCNKCQVSLPIRTLDPDHWTLIFIMYKDKILKLLRSSKTAFLSGEELASKARHLPHHGVEAHQVAGARRVRDRGGAVAGIPDHVRARHPSAERHQARGSKQRSSEKKSTSSRESFHEHAGHGDGVEGRARRHGRDRRNADRRQRAGSAENGSRPKGNLYLSVILRPDIPTHKAPLITLMGAVAVASAIRKHVRACRPPSSGRMIFSSPARRSAAC